jgi:hypothetical protein
MTDTFVRRCFMAKLAAGLGKAPCSALLSQAGRASRSDFFSMALLRLVAEENAGADQPRD